MEEKSYQIFFLLVPVMLAFFPRGAEAARLYLSPVNRKVEVGQTLEISIFIDTEEDYINAADVSLKFDPHKLRVEKSTITASKIEVWVTQPTFSNTAGSIQFIGGVPSPGIKDAAALLSTITFRAVAQGIAYVYFEDDCKLIENSSEAADVLTSSQNGSYELVISPPGLPEITSPTHPEQEMWYQDRDPVFTWMKDDEVTSFSYDLNQLSSAVPDKIAEGSETSVNYEGLEGIWYFHLRAERAGVWGETSHYRVKIDSTAPEISNPEVIPSTELPEGIEPEISLTADDNLSGISRWEIKYRKDGGPEEVIKSGISFPYRIPFSEAGEYSVSIAAYDEAGNFREKELTIRILGKKEPFLMKGIFLLGVFVPWWLIIITILILAAIMITLFLWRRRQRKTEDRLSSETESGKLDF